MTEINLKYLKIWKVLGAKGLVLILIASLWPQAGEPISIEHLDKYLHFLTYAIASFYFHQILQNNKTIKIISYLFLYSAFIEGLQGMTESRYFEVADLFANLFGIFFGFYISKKIKLIKKIDNLIG